MKKDYEKILAQLTQEEQERLFLIMRKYNWVLNKIDAGQSLTQAEQDFIDFRPHEVNRQLSVDLVERTIFYI